MKSKEELEGQWFFDFLRCPDCDNSMCISGQIVCKNCGYSRSFQKPVDLRPTREKRVAIELKTGPALVPQDILEYISIGRPAEIFKGPSGERDSRELMSEMISSVPANGRVLDLGCGTGDQARAITSAGYQYVGVDYSNSSADVLADAHSIPFVDSSFECVFSYAVLEHLHSPHVAIREIERVLRPGGLFIGTVSQGEPFHASYFHHTTWGLAALAASSTAMRLSRLWCGPGTLLSLATMGRYPKVIRTLISAVDRIDTWAPWLAPRREYWSQREKQLDALHRAGSICFVMEKANGVTC